MGMFVSSFLALIAGDRDSLQKVTSKRPTLFEHMIYWWWLLCCLKASLVLKHIRMCCRATLMTSISMICKWMSGPESFLALVAGNRDSFQVIGLNVILQICLSFLFPTTCASIQWMATGTFACSFHHHWSCLVFKLLQISRKVLW